MASQILRSAVNYNGDRLRELLATKTSRELSVYDLRTEVEGNLWMLAPEAFRYFLPAFLYASLESYPSVSIFVSELVGALTEPSRTDVVEALDRATMLSSGLGLPDDMTELLRKQQLEWFDSGTPLAIFHERFDSLTSAEGGAILDFFVVLQEAHGADFPFKELEIAVDRYWSRYRAMTQYNVIRQRTEDLIL
ncbi:hypothetical protein [Coleofasciculus sp.]|uniref:hypothetical protein n=1 Tax=Coleofasciculus sp. TaxID=3100458 RepID=UPI003A3BDF14